MARVMVTAGMGCMMALASRGAENKGEAEAKPGGAGELVQALELVRLVKQPYLLEFASAAGGRYVIKYEDLYTGKRRRFRTPFIPAGAGRASEFFKNPPLQDKFRLFGVVERQLKNPATGIVLQVRIATVEVIRGPKKGTRYEISRFNKRFIVRDYKAVLTLKVPGGEEQQFEVADGEAFALPYDAEAVEKPYTFKEVDHNEAVVIGWTADGVAQTRVLSP